MRNAPSQDQPSYALGPPPHRFSILPAYPRAGREVDLPDAFLKRTISASPDLGRSLSVTGNEMVALLLSKLGRTSEGLDFLPKHSEMTSRWVWASPELALHLPLSDLTASQA